MHSYTIYEHTPDTHTIKWSHVYRCALFRITCRAWVVGVAREYCALFGKNVKDGCPVGNVPR